MFKISYSLLLSLIVIFFFACHQSEHSQPKSLNIANYKIDSLELNSFVLQQMNDDEQKKILLNFYKVRNYQLAWFDLLSLKPSYSIFEKQLHAYEFNYADSSLNNNKLDSLMILYQLHKSSFVGNHTNFQQLDVLLTINYLQFIQRSAWGIKTNLKALKWYIPRKTIDLSSKLHQGVLLKLEDSLQDSISVPFNLLQNQLNKYRKIQRRGGFPKITKASLYVKFGSSDSSLIAIKQYLFLTGDLQNSSKTILFNDSLKIALKRFQQRMGLIDNGKLYSSTIKCLSLPIDFWIKKMMINLERLRWMPLEIESNYMVINIPEYKLHVYENHQLLWSSKIIVGLPASPTNIFTRKISQITFNPYWVIPTSIIQNDIVPKVKVNPKFLEENNMEVFYGDSLVDLKAIDWFSYSGNVPFLIRQKPGVNNALGRMIFLFPNKFNTYLHDTPAQSLFDDPQRALSHGCIRMENSLKLANYLLRKNPKWTNEKILETLASEIKVEVKINPTLPIYMVYFTAWINQEGILNFRDDLYGLDNQLFRLMVECE
jgi:murein L,D-transpeptidase YcbB/YkuD